MPPNAAATMLTQLLTVTLTLSDVTWPAPSVPVTVVVCAPLETRVVSQGIEVGCGEDAGAVATT